jgi:hypothetical protein
MNINQTCDDNQCIEGCFCPVGMVLDYNGFCVLPEECPCVNNGKIFYDGQHVESNCKIW